MKPVNELTSEVIDGVKEIIGDIDHVTEADLTIRVFGILTNDRIKNAKQQLCQATANEQPIDAYRED